MLKLFGSGKKKKSSTAGLKPGNLKIPIPMINGVQYADMTESQISALIGGGNKGEPPIKKSVSSISSQRTNNTTNTEKSPAATTNPAVVPSRSISSPPVLVMPRPIYSLPRTRFLLRSHDYEKTQVESNEDEDSSSESDEEDIVELFPRNVITTATDPITTTTKEQPILSGVERGKSPIVTFNDEGVATVESPRENDKNHQSVSSVMRTSDDSIRQYISASESSFFTTSSVSNMNNNNNLLNARSSYFSSSPLTTSFTQENQSSSLRNQIETTTPPNNMTHTSFVSARSFDPNIDDIPPVMEASPLSQEIIEPPTPKNKKESFVTPSNNNNADANQFSAPAAQDVFVQKSVTPQQQKKREKTPLRYNNNNRASSSSPLHVITAVPKKVTRPASSSASSATIGLDVTPISQSRLINNSDKPPGNQLRSISSEQSSFQNNNNNNSVIQPLLEENNSSMAAISDLQSQMQKMALSEDLEELKRTVDRMQQQRVSDREEHLTRVKEQKLREKEILDQINTAKQRLEMAIAEKFFMEDLHNTKDADLNALNATLPQQQLNGLENIQQQQQNQQQQQQQQKKPLRGNSIEEEYMMKPQPTLKPYTSTSSTRRRLKANSSNEALRHQQPDMNRPQENNRSRGGRKPNPSIPNQADNRQQDPYMSTESYFPDVNKTDFEYIGNLHGPPQHHQFFPPIPNKFRNPNGNMRNYYADMEFMDGNRSAFDSPRLRNNMRPQRRQRSKSVESQCMAQDFMDQQQQQLQQQQYQQIPPHQHEFSYDLVDPLEGYRFIPAHNGRTPRSRKSSLYSARSNLSDSRPTRNASNHDLQSSGYHSAAEEDELINQQEDVEDINNNRHSDHGLSANNSRANSDGEQRPSQQFQHDDPTIHRPSRSNSGRYRRRHPPPSNNMNGPMPPSMMYHNPAFGPPPPHMSHMGMMNDRDRIKMRPPPPYGYNNMPPSGAEYYPYIPHQRVSPRMMAAFTEDQQWNGPPVPPPPHHPQWGPHLNNSNQSIYGIPPPQGGPENMKGGISNGAANGGSVVNGPPPHPLQDNQNENNFSRRYVPGQPAALQQTPQQSQHGYLSIYTDAPHRLYL